MIEFTELGWHLEGWVPKDKENTGTIPLASDKQKLLWGKKPIFAANDPENLISLLNEGGDIVQQLKIEYGDKFVGLILYGSTGEGYRELGSDLDAAIIVRDPSVSGDITKRINDRFKGRWGRDPFSNTITLDEKMAVTNKSLIPYLFQGAFLGKKDDLDKSQLASVSALDSPAWDEVRRKTEGMLSGPHLIGRLKERHNLEEADDFIMQGMRKLLRVPPDYQTTLAILTKRQK
jgi:hypothetical protein